MRPHPLFALSVVFSLGLSTSQSPPQAAQKIPAQAIKVAEGSYSPYDDWILWRTAEGYRVDMQMHWADPKGALQTEWLWLTPDFRMKAVKYDSRGFAGVPDGALECEVREESLECASNFKGVKGKGSIPVAGSYGTQFGVEIALLDVPWFFASLAAHGARKLNETSPVGVVSLALDGDTPERRVRANPIDGELRYLGRETIAVLDRRVPSHKFKLTARHYDATLWVSEAGLLLALDWGGLRLNLTSYRQFENFIPELEGAREVAKLPEAPQEKQPVTGAKLDATSPARTKVAEGGFYYSSEAGGNFIGGWTDDWMLWRTAEGLELETIIHVQGRPEKARVTEILRMTPQFRITYFRENNPSWDEQKDGFYECRLKRDTKNSQLECRNTMWGLESAGEIPIRAPYLFELAEAQPLLDWPWSHASMVSAVARDASKPAQLPMLFLSSGDEHAGARNATPVTRIKEVQFLGNEPIKIMGRSILAYKYKIADEMIVWVARSGMPLALQHPTRPRHWELKRFTQYEPIIPELN